MMRRLGTLLLAAMLLATSFGTPEAAALPAGASMMRGYFTNGYQTGRFNRVMVDGISDCAGDCTNKQAFINFIKFKYNENTRHHTGAAFVVHTMLNKGEKNREITAAQWAEWEARINNPAISLSREYFSYGVNSGYSATYNDDVYYPEGGTYDSLVFRYNGSIVYVIKAECVNPVGDFSGIPAFNPDQAVEGALSANCSVLSGWLRDRDYLAVGVDVHIYRGGPAGSGAPAFVFPYNGGNGRTEVYRGDIGTNGTYGFNINLSALGLADGGAHPLYVYGLGMNTSGAKNGNNFVWATTVGPCLNYTLVPSISTPTTTVEAGQSTTVDFTHSILKTGTRSGDTSWAVKEFVAPPGVAVNTSQPYVDNQLTNASNPFAGGVPITDIATGGPIVITAMNTSDANLPAFAAVPPLTVGSHPAGSRICRFLAIDPAARNVSGAEVRGRWSRPACVTVGKRPFMTIVNGDAWAGGTFAATDPTCAIGPTPGGFTGTSGSYSNGTYGSFGEYGIFALGSVSNFGSAGKPLDISLTFKRTGGSFFTATGIGVSDLTSHCLLDARDFVNTNGASNAGATWPLNGSRDGTYTRTGDVRLITSSDIIKPGQHVTLVVEGDITISDDIVFPEGPYTHPSQLPSLTVIATGTGNIFVDSDVTRIDGLFQAYGNFVTCTESQSGGVGTDSPVCQQPLEVNGSVTAGKLVLRRIAGNEAASRTPAEMFRMRPDVFLSRYGVSTGTGNIRSINEKELPPRY